MVLELIRQAGDKAIWVRTLKVKTNLPQPAIAKALKTLEGQKLVKAVKSIKVSTKIFAIFKRCEINLIQFPTRKMYLLESIIPSIELTGGPWYSGAEFDTEFINNMRKYCLKIIWDAVSGGINQAVRAH